MTWDIIGQERAIAVLRKAVEDESRLSHAYLFAGPERVGKATAARRFAQALNCDRHPGNQDSGGQGFLAPPENADELGKARLREDADTVSAPCGECRTCRLIAEDKHADVEFVGVGGICDETEHRDHGADGSRDIRICQIRRLEKVVSRSPFEARYRVIIIDPADALTQEAANAFLKTLEEPPPSVVLVLVTAREAALRETVRSRCRRVGFSGVPRAEIEAALQERWQAEPELASRLARLAQGRLGWAVAALEDERLLIDRDEVMDEIEALLAGGDEERFGYAASLGARYSRDPATVRSSLAVWDAWWGDVLLVAAGQESLAAETERLDTLRLHAAQYKVAGAVTALNAVADARRHLEEHASPTLALEVMLLELPRAGARAGS